MRLKGVFHILSARLENIDQIPMAAFEIVQYIA
jgi:hypothetical protein